MNEFKPKETDFVGEIKKQVEDFIRKSSIPDEYKKTLIEEVGMNWCDDRFDATKFINDAIGFSVCKWEGNNFNLAEMWKEIAINNSKVNNDPHKVADETIARFKEEFNCA